MNCRTLGEDKSTVKHQPDITRLHGIFAQYADIQAVYLFGSRAAGTAHAGSDLDLAILPRHFRLQRKSLVQTSPSPKEEDFHLIPLIRYNHYMDADKR